MDKKVISEYLKVAQEKLAAAKLLFENEMYDDAVSRAYYSAFHCAQALLLNEGLKAETHSGVQ